MNWPDNFVNKIICGDCLEVMKQMPDECVDMAMTSPPYWGLRDYGIEQIFGGDKDCEHEWVEEKMTLQHENRNLITGTQEQAHKKRGTTFIKKYDDKKAGFCSKCGAWKGQLGLESTPEMYIEHLIEIFNEVARVLKKEGTLWLNIGDTYNSSPSNQQYKSQRGFHGGEAGMGRQKRNVSDIPPKCLLMIPERLSWSLIQNGWILRNKIIWFKPNSMPSSVKDRFSNRWEGLFLFVKNSKPVYWTNKKTGELITKQPLGIKGQEGIDWEWEEVGIVDKNVFNVRVRDADKERFMQKASKEEKESYGKSKLKKISLWTAHDYYFDLDAVREPCKTNGDYKSYENKPKISSRGKAIGKKYKAGRDNLRKPNYLSGKNPGDVIHTPAETRTLGAILGVKGAIKVPGGKGWVGHPKGGGAACQKDPRWCPPEGKNPGDFLEINTQPFPEAHFAVFPETLCEKPIKAGCPEQACKRCGKAREHVSKPKFTNHNGKTETSYNKKTTSAGRLALLRQKARESGREYINERIYLGWTFCNCNTGFEPGIVLDPFAGAGTVGVVAKKLGRRFILIDIKKEYCEMAEKRIAQVGYQMELRI